jgi:putative ABC transport system permease protein
VETVESRVTFFATLDLPALETPGIGRFVSVPEREPPRLNDIYIREGRNIAPGARDEAVVSDNFAVARGLGPGDTIRATINGRAWQLRVVGIAISPEHAYAVPPGALYPEDDRYGVFWMSEEVLGPAYDMAGAFNEVFLTLTPDANPVAVLAHLDDLLEPYGGQGAYLREDQPSHQILEGEFDENRVMGTVIPAIFLGVAAFLLNLVLGRLISTQRTEIAVLKAFGYTNREVGVHYLWYALAAVFAGTLVGIGAGAWLGGAYIGLYAEYFDFPALEYRLSIPLALLAAGVSGIAALTGALAAVWRAVSLPPAQAMRPEPPTTFKPGPFERLGLGKALPSSGRMILRNMERTPVRSILSAVGVAFSVAILVIEMFLYDGVRFMMDLQFRQIQREDLTVSFERAVNASVRHDLENVEGVTRVETFRVVPARIRSGHLERELGLLGLEEGGMLRRLVNSRGEPVPIPFDGVAMSLRLAEELGLGAGDRVSVEILEGERLVREVVVAATVDDLLGVTATMSAGGLRRLVGGPDVASGAYLSVDETRRSDVNERLKEMPLVSGVGSPATALASFESALAETLFVAIAFILGFACVISVAIIYNGARLSLSERGRDLASLRVMGFRRGEVATLLLGEQAVVTLAAIPIGWALGYALSLALARALATDLFRIPLITSPRALLISAVITVVAAAASAWIVRRRIDHLDLIAVLKTRE